MFKADNERRALSLGLSALLLTMAACAGQRVAVPPRIDLTEYQVVGLVKFSCNEEGGLDEYVTEQFLEYVLAGQPGVRVLELPSEADLLASTGYRSLGPEALVAIGERYRVASIITGDLQVEDVKPKVNLMTIISSLSVRADVQARLTARMVEASSGATIWRSSADAEKTVGEVQAFGDGTVLFDAEDPDRAYGDLVAALVDIVTTDFRVTWQRVRK